MQRIVKRFLLHKQRESDEIGEIDLEELKQDLQMVRFETLNDLKRIRNESNHLLGYLSQKLLLIGDEIFKDGKSANAIRFKEIKKAESDYQETLDDFDKKGGQNFYSTSCNSDSIDSGLQSIRDLTTVADPNNQIFGSDKKTNSFESLSSLDTQTENFNDQIIERTPAKCQELKKEASFSSLDSEKDELNEESLDYQKTSNNNLHVINEEDEISTEFTSDKERHD